MRIITVVGARPQFVKAAPVSRALMRRAGDVERIVHTGQHYDQQMSASFFEQLGLPVPSHNLGIGSGTHGAQTGAMLAAVETVIVAEHPDVVLVYGDTNSTLAGALAAAKLHVPLIHVEAGLRSFNRRMPEEVNRVLTDHCSDVLYAPTTVAVKNLMGEGLGDRHVVNSGDVMYDATLTFGRHVAAERILQRYGLQSKQFALATIHRAENTEDPRRLAVIIESLGQLARQLRVVLPLHPRTRARLAGASPEAGLVVIEPVSYFEMLGLERESALVLTDSGGVQKEAFFNRVPCVTLRDETEWLELIRLGANRLAPPLTVDGVVAAARAALDAGFPVVDELPYGRGDAADLIVDDLLQWLES